MAVTSSYRLKEDHDAAACSPSPVEVSCGWSSVYLAPGRVLELVLLCFR